MIWLQFTTVMWGQWGKLTTIVSQINESSVFQSSRLFVLWNPEFPWKIPEPTEESHQSMAWIYVHVSLSYLSKLKALYWVYRAGESGVCCWVLSELTVAREGLLTWQNTVKIKRDWWQMSFLILWSLTLEMKMRSLKDENLFPLWNTAFLKWSFRYNESIVKLQNDTRASWMNQRQQSSWLSCVIAHVRNRLKFNPSFTTRAMWCTSHSTEERTHAV